MEKLTGKNVIGITWFAEAEQQRNLAKHWSLTKKDLNFSSGIQFMFLNGMEGTTFFTDLVLCNKSTEYRHFFIQPSRD